MKHLGHTPPFRESNGEIIRNSIAETSYLKIGGIDQWVMIRGKNVSNPILILLHGGPGFPEMRLFRHFNGEIESKYTVVYWEQRGTDKSFDRRIPKSSLTIEQFISDLDEVVESVCNRFAQEKVVIYGHSWGSVLGVLYAKRFPQKIAAYVGAGQIGDWPASELASYTFTLKEAARRKNLKALKELHKIGPPPHTFRNLIVQRKWFVRFAGFIRGMSLWKFFRVILGGPESSIFDLANILRSQTFSAKIMWPEISSVNLMKIAPELEVPVFFFIGRHDHLIDCETSLAYYNILKAPFKRFIWFEESAHEPSFEEPEKFNASMIELVLPVALQEMHDNKNSYTQNLKRVNN